MLLGCESCERWRKIRGELTDKNCLNRTGGSETHLHCGRSKEAGKARLGKVKGRAKLDVTSMQGEPINLNEIESTK